MERTKLMLIVFIILSSGGAFGLLLMGDSANWNFLWISMIAQAFGFISLWVAEFIDNKVNK